jgi:hypothetical protein
VCVLLVEQQQVACHIVCFDTINLADAWREQSVVHAKAFVFEGYGCNDTVFISEHKVIVAVILLHSERLCTVEGLVDAASGTTCLKVSNE